MYCIHCGADGAAAFCRSCGKRQGSSSRDKSQDDQSDRTILSDQKEIAEASCMHSTWQGLEELFPIEDTLISSSQKVNAIAETNALGNWFDSLDYKDLIRSEYARMRLKAATSKSKQGITGEEVLAILEAVVPGNVPLSKLTHAVVPVIDKLGIRTSNKSQAVWQSAPGRVLLSFLCVLASKSLAVGEVKQHQDACEISAKLPLGVFTNPGKITAMLESKLGWVRFSLAVTISGQLFDWGKSKKLIEEFLVEMNQDLIDQYSGRPVAYQRVA